MRQEKEISPNQNGYQRSSSSHGFKPVCFLKAVEKCEIDEYPSIIETSVTLRPFSYKR